MTRVSISQPAYLPWIGYFNRLYHSDIHIVLDHVAMDHNSRTKFTNRNKIRTANGWIWLTVPLQHRHKENTAINQIKISSTTHWQNKHWQSIKHNYAKTPYFHLHETFFDELYQYPWQSLNDLCREITHYIIHTLTLKTRLIYSSSLQPTQTKSALILELCKKTQATHYISGPFGKDYLQQQNFARQHINISFQTIKHPIYPQAFTDFEPFMSSIDLLFNTGPQAKKIIANAWTMVDSPHE